MDRRIFAICLLTLMAVALLFANFAPRAAIASDAVNERDYKLATARLQSGGEGLYIVDGKTGLIAIFTYDSNARRLLPRAVQPVADAFPQR